MKKLIIFTFIVLIITFSAGCDIMNIDGTRKINEFDGEGNGERFFDAPGEFEVNWYYEGRDEANDVDNENDEASDYFEIELTGDYEVIEDDEGRIIDVIPEDPRTIGGTYGPDNGSYYYPEGDDFHINITAQGEWRIVILESK